MAHNTNLRGIFIYFQVKTKLNSSITLSNVTKVVKSPLANLRSKKFFWVDIFSRMPDVSYVDF